MGKNKAVIMPFLGFKESNYNNQNSMILAQSDTQNNGSMKRNQEYAHTYVISSSTT